MFTRSVVLLLLSLFLAGSMVTAEAQTYPYNIDTKPPRGFMPTADQLSSSIDNIDTVSGKVHTQVPLASLPPGRGGLSFDLELVYDSHLYDMFPTDDIQQLSNVNTSGGWTYSVKNYRLDFEVRAGSGPCSIAENQRTFRVRIGLPDGSLHILHLRGYGDEMGDSYWGDGFYGIDLDGNRGGCAAASGRYPSDVRGRLTYYTSDGSFLKFEIDADGANWQTKYWTLYFPDGRRVVGQNTEAIEQWDANGNRLRFVNSCYDFPSCNRPYTRAVDDFDREVKIDFNVTNANRAQDTRMEDRVYGPGPLGTITWTINWETMTIGNDGRSYVCGSGSFQCSLSFTHWIVKYVQLPLQLASNPPTPWNSYTFGYSDNADSGFGELDYIKTPSGAEYTYRYRLEGNPSPRTEDLLQYNSVRERGVTQDGKTLRWMYSFTDTNSTIVNPDGGTITNSFYDPRNIHWWYRGLVYRIDEPLGSVRKRSWSQNKAYGVAGAANTDPNNPYVQLETTTVGSASGQPSKTAGHVFDFDKNGNLQLHDEYDWGPYNPTGVENGTTLKRETQFTYHVSVPAANVVTNSPLAYWQPHDPMRWPQVTLPRRLNALRRREVCEQTCSGTPVAVAEFDYDNPYTSGNVTAEKRWDSQKSSAAPSLGSLNSANAQVLTRAYDANGNLTDIFEPEVRTKITYDAIPGYVAPGPYPTRVDYAFGTSAQRSWTYGWNNVAGVIDSKRDANNNITTMYTYDSVGRRRSVNEANVRLTETIYDDANRKLTVKRDLSSYTDGKLQVVTSYDRLGRVILLQTSEGTPLSASNDGVKVRTIHSMDSNGRRVITSTPYRTTSDLTLEWSCTQFDRLGRVTAMAMFRGGQEPSDCQSAMNRTGITQTLYDADRLRVTDPAGKVRDEYRDVLARLTQVTEDPGGSSYITNYQYDALDNLRQVTQPDGANSQARSFTYSSLGRLTSATNPESGATTYTYLDNGNLDSRTDARGYTTRFTYDELQRIRTKTYSNDGGVTPQVTYEYYLSGSPAPNIGQLRSVISNVATTTYSNYDQLGRFGNQTQSIAGYPTELSFTYTRWLNDEIKTMQYPSGRLVSYSIDDAGRLNKVSSGAKTYADLTSLTVTNPYTADGRIAMMKLGNELWETRDYRTPGNATTLRLGTSMGTGDKLELEYNYDSFSNNGNLISHVIRQPGRTWTQTYGYDNVNRLKTASEIGGFNQTYGYDRYGNRWLSSNSGLTWSDSHEPTANVFSPSNNRISTAAYDAAGNLTSYDPRTLTYDAENRLISITSASNGNGSFAYDGDGRRVKRQWTPTGGVTTTNYYFYDAAGKLASQYSDSESTDSGASYIFSDLLGTVRAITGEKPPSGTAPLTECYDPLPFGRLLSSTDNSRNTGCYPANPDTTLTSTVPQKFTGKERDAETGLDFFGARYMSAAQGRFTSPDFPLIDQDPSDPESWNLYAYVRNNPLKYIDPTGQDCLYTDDIDSKGSVSVERGNCSRKRGTFVDGTIDVDSITYDSRKRSLGYNYSGSEGTIGTRVIGLSVPRGDELDAKGLAFASGMAARVDASNEAIKWFAAGTTLAGIGLGVAPVAGQALNEFALGPSMGRLFFEGAAGAQLAVRSGLGRTLVESPLGQLYAKWGEPLAGRTGWQVLSRFWASGATGAANIFPSFTNPRSLLWKTELPALVRNWNVLRIWR